MFIHGAHSEYVNIGFSDTDYREENTPSPQMSEYGAFTVNAYSICNFLRTVL